MYLRRRSIILLVIIIIIMEDTLLGRRKRSGGIRLNRGDGRSTNEDGEGMSIVKEKYERK